MFGIYIYFRYNLDTISRYRRHWIQALPDALIGLRSALPEDTDTSPFQKAFGTSMRLPGDILTPPPRTEGTQRGLHHDTKAKFFVPKDLQKCKQVFIKVVTNKRSLQPPYMGPFVITKRDKISVTVLQEGREIRYPLERVKPAHVLAEEPANESRENANRSENRKIVETRPKRDIKPPSWTKDYVGQSKGRKPSPRGGPPTADLRRSQKATPQAAIGAIKGAAPAETEHTQSVRHGEQCRRSSDDGDRNGTRSRTVAARANSSASANGSTRANGSSGTSKGQPKSGSSAVRKRRTAPRHGTTTAPEAGTCTATSTPSTRGKRGRRRRNKNRSKTEKTASEAQAPSSGARNGRVEGPVRSHRDMEHVGGTANKRQAASLTGSTSRGEPCGVPHSQFERPFSGPPNIERGAAADNSGKTRYRPSRTFASRIFRPSFPSKRPTVDQAERGEVHVTKGGDRQASLPIVTCVSELANSERR
ncbi:multicellular organismal development [Nesidiocoris tenuis]|uniref:Multicellular organismal development n=1 Tax=Nesidiocoris tenuis TaxID=355587 RepID=A0ABN7ACP6_9HEMI|nr:multicellular organismal development [Nesidiocoris tenuis]